jgi:hypothetical protein
MADRCTEERSHSQSFRQKKRHRELTKDDRFVDRMKNKKQTEKRERLMNAQKEG